MAFNFPRRRHFQSASSAPPGFPVEKGLRETLDFYEKLMILQTLQRASGNRTRAAELLQVSRVDLWRRMRRLKIDLQLIPRGKPGRKKKVT